MLSKDRFWLDRLDRQLIGADNLAQLQGEALAGVTIDPRQVATVIAGSRLYDETIRTLEGDGRSLRAIGEAILFDDAQRAAGALAQIYTETDGAAGFVSLAVNPALATTADNIVAEGQRVGDRVGRVNVMVEVPATAAGIAALEALVEDGRNVLVSGVFTPSVYEVATNAYLRGLQSFFKEDAGRPLPPAAAVRVPTGWLSGAVDAELLRLGLGHQGQQVTLATAALIHSSQQDLVSGSRWQALAAAGGHPPLLLWDGRPAPHYRDSIRVLAPGEWAGEADGADSSLWTTPMASEDAWKQLAAQQISLTELAERLREEAASSLREGYQELSEAIMEKRARFVRP